MWSITSIYGLATYAKEINMQDRSSECRRYWKICEPTSRQQWKRGVIAKEAFWEGRWIIVKTGRQIIFF